MTDNHLTLTYFSPFFFFRRFEKLKAKDNDFEFRFNNLGNLIVKNGGTEFNWESNIENVQWFFIKIKENQKTNKTKTSHLIFLNM